MTAFKKEQMVPASKLRTLSQRELFQMLDEQGKLGVLFRDSLAAVMLPHAKYVELIHRIDELEDALKIQADSEQGKNPYTGSTKRTG